MNSAALYPMKKVIERTGLSDHVIRVWERRYQAVSPKRTETKRRTYTEDDIAKLQFLKILTDSGHSIRNIAHMSIEMLSKLVVLENQKNAKPVIVENELLPVDTLIDNCLSFIKNFDSYELENVIRFAERTMSLDSYLIEFIDVLLVRIGTEWEKGNIKISHEHLASAVIRKFLAVKLSEINPEEAKSSIVFTTPAGQFHEMGVLISALLAAQRGIRSIFLGPNLPAKDIAYSANHEKTVKMIVLSVIYPINDPVLLEELEELKSAVKDHVQIAVGGNSLEFYKKKIDELGLLTLNNFNDCISLYEKNTKES